MTFLGKKIGIHNRIDGCTLARLIGRPAVRPGERRGIAPGRPPATSGVFSRKPAIPAKALRRSRIFGLGNSLEEKERFSVIPAFVGMSVFRCWGAGHHRVALGRSGGFNVKERRTVLRRSPASAERPWFFGNAPDGCRRRACFRRAAASSPPPAGDGRCPARRGGRWPRPQARRAAGRLRPTRKCREEGPTGRGRR